MKYDETQLILPYIQYSIIISSLRNSLDAYFCLKNILFNFFYLLINCQISIFSEKQITNYHNLFYSSSDLKLEHIYTVRLGMYNICTTENTTSEYQVEKVQVHELYATKKPYFDICLLTLANSTDAYEPLCLPSGGKY